MVGRGKLTGLVVAGVLALTNVSGARPADAELIGVWGAEKRFGPAGPVRVIIDLSEGIESAQAFGVQTAVELDDTAIRFRLPHGLGRFRGTLAAERIEGHFVSESDVLAFSPYATPLELERTGPSVFAGEMVPFRQSFSVYIAIRRDNDGTLRAFLRNPERNQGVYTRLHGILREGTRIVFTDAAGHAALNGVLDADAGTLSVSMPWRGGTYDLTRRGRAEAPGFYPTRQAGPVRYVRPPVLDDGWRTTAANEVGLRETVLAALLQRIVDTEPDSLRTPQVHSVLVARRGHLVLEAYFHGYRAEIPHDLRSASKSVTGIMLGQAIEDSASLTLDTPVVRLFPGLPTGADARLGALTVAHLASMQTGFDCDDNDESTPGHEDRMHAQREEPDWYRCALTLPFVRDPGTRGVYCTAALNVLGGAISAASGRWLPDFFAHRLAEPLDIRRYHVNLDPMYRGYAGGGLHLVPRDFLKFAQLVLDRGTWHGRRVVPAAWIDTMLAPHASVHTDGDYGLAWWRGELRYRGRTVRMFSATGNGGQLLVVVPDLELAVAFTGGNYSDFRTWIAWRDELVPDYVLDAVSD